MNIIDKRKTKLTYVKDLTYGDYFYFNDMLCMITDEPIPYESREYYRYNYVDLSNGITDYIADDDEVELVDVDIIVKIKHKEI